MVSTRTERDVSYITFRMNRNPFSWYVLFGNKTIGYVRREGGKWEARSGPGTAKASTVTVKGFENKMDAAVALIACRGLLGR